MSTILAIENSGNKVTNSPEFSKRQFGKTGNTINQIVHKQGQMKIQQMIFMLLAVFVLFALVFLFYAILSFGNLRIDARNSEIERIAGISAKAASIPEFNFNGQENSIDADKIMILKGKRYSNLYPDFFGINGIIIEKVYPGNNSDECTMSNYPNCGIISLFNSQKIAKSESAGVFVALCRKQTIEDKPYDKCELARMIIELKNTTS